MSSAERPTRTEQDSLGSREIQAPAYWGVHTARAVENFRISGRYAHPALIIALAQVKAACVRANHELGFLDDRTGPALLQAAEEIIAGGLGDQFVTDALQGGAGTSANMNMNEVLANRACEILGQPLGTYAPVSPLGHANLHQSTNDVYPTAIKVAAINKLRLLEKAVAGLQTEFQAREQDFRDILKVGRTQLQDAVPLTLGAECSAWAECLSRDRWRIFKCEERLRVVNLGGTAVGTGITAPRSYIFLVVEKLREVTGQGLSRAENLVDATQNADAFVEVSGILKAHAVNLFKISSDLRLLSSGPRAGLGELRLPPRQAGSSLMPGKVNPVICEAVGQAALQVMACDLAVTQAAQLGQLELNAFLPLLADNLLTSLDLLIRANTVFTTHCIAGLQADRETCAAHLQASTALITALVPRLGYDLCADIAAEADRTDRPVGEIVLERGLLDAPELDRLLSVESMTALGHR